MPSTNPELVEYGFAISPGTENFMTIRADVLHSDENIEKISYIQRGCYMDGEKDLRFYRQYAYLNCFMECSSNHTFDVRYTGKQIKLERTHYMYLIAISKYCWGSKVLISFQGR